MLGVIDEFNDALWSTQIDKSIVNKVGTIKFRFMNGKEIIEYLDNKCCSGFM